MNWFAYGVVLLIAAWAIWRGYEAYSFQQLLKTMDGDLTDPVVRQFVSILSQRKVPNAHPIWARLKGIEMRVMTARAVAPSLKEEFHHLMEVKGTGF